MPNRNYPPHIQRMMVERDERDELDDKIDKIGKFMFDPEQFVRLDIEDQELLKQQFKVMVEYDKILKIRINKFLKSLETK